MGRIAEPLNAMGADVTTDHGHAPVTIVGGGLHGIVCEPRVPSAQVKGAVLLAGLDADGVTEVREPAATRDHTERSLAALEAPVEERGLGLGEAVPARGVRPRSRATLLGGVPRGRGGGHGFVADGPERRPEPDGSTSSRCSAGGCAPSSGLESHELGEPVGTPGGAVRRHGRVHVGPDEVPLVIDEIPVLALLAANADAESTFLGAGELRLKESNRLGSLVEGIREPGGDSAVVGDDLVVGGRRAQRRSV